VHKDFNPLPLKIILISYQKKKLMKHHPNSNIAFAKPDSSLIAIGAFVATRGTYLIHTQLGPLRNSLRYNFGPVPNLRFYS
jgi:hypothetical protein